MAIVLTDVLLFICLAVARLWPRAFPTGPFDALFAGMADQGCFTVFLSGIASMHII